MKKPFLFLVTACLAVVASGQKAYFLYLQTDDLSPFYVRMADKIYSSSVSGYLILPNLTDSTYAVGIGFPKSTTAETRFAIPVQQTDKGYLLKNFSDGLALFDIEELSVIKSVSNTKNNSAYETKTDKFSSVLSKAANDPSLLKVPVAKKEEPKLIPEKKEEVVVKKEETGIEQQDKAVTKADQKEAKSMDSALTKPAEKTEPKTEKPDVAIKTEPASSTETKSRVEAQPITANETALANAEDVPYKPSSVTRRSESSTTEGFGVIYFDKMQDKTDTVRILIPPSKFTLEPIVDSEAEKKQEAPVVHSEAVNAKAQTDVTGDSAKQSAERGGAITAKVATTCKEVASEKDFMKLRKNMAAKSGDDDMIFEAKKAFRLRCYTSEQVRYLSTLFLTPAGKYNFFDTAYNAVSDRQSFAALQSELKDEYYLKRFKALVGE